MHRRHPRALGRNATRQSSVLRTTVPELIVVTILSVLSIALLVVLLFVVPALVVVGDLRSGRADPEVE